MVGESTQSLELVSPWISWEPCGAYRPTSLQFRTLFRLNYSLPKRWTTNQRSRFVSRPTLIGWRRRRTFTEIPSVSATRLTKEKKTELLMNITELSELITMKTGSRGEGGRMRRRRGVFDLLLHWSTRRPFITVVISCTSVVRRSGSSIFIDVS